MSIQPTSNPPQIRQYHQHLPSPLPSSPSFQLHVTRLKDTLFIWVGAGAPTPTVGSEAGGAGNGLAGLIIDAEAETGEAAGTGAGGGVEKVVARDWAVSMPVRAGQNPVSTPLYRSASSDLAEPMSQRLARKFPSNQFHLSLSLPPTLTAASGPSLDPYASRTLLMMEKALSKYVAEVLEQDRVDGRTS